MTNLFRNDWLNIFGLTDQLYRNTHCYDNAVMGNFFGLMKSEFLKEFESVDHFKEILAIYIDYHNNKRIKTKKA